MAARSEDQGPCKRGCCWTPFEGICPKSRACDHHAEFAQSAIDKEAADFARQIEIADFGGNAKWMR